MTAPPGVVTLAPVEEVVLRMLVQVATTDAAADEVTPRLDADPGWSPARIAWLREFHRDRRQAWTARPGRPPGPSPSTGGW